MKLRKFFEIIGILLFSLFFLLAPLGADKLILWICLIVFYFYFYQCLKKPLIVFSGVKSWFKIDLFFLLFYYLLFYLPYQTYIFGSNSILENSWISNSYFEYSNKAIIASTIGLISFFLGFNSKDKIVNQNRNYRDYSFSEHKKLYLIILFMTLFLFCVFYFLGGSKMLIGSYLGTRTKNAALDGVYTLLSVFTSILAAYSIIFYIKFKKLSFWFFISAFIIFIYGYLTLVGGDRNTFFILALSAIGPFYTYVRSISKRTLFIYIALALSLYQVIEVARMADVRNIKSIIDVATGDLNLRTTSKIDANVDSGSFSITNLVTRAVFHYVPNQHDFFYGKFKIIGFAGFIPYARGFITSSNDEDLSSSRYITRVNNSGFGLGSSIIMDSYIEYGLFGIFFFLFLLGRIGKFFEVKVISNPTSLKWGVLYFVVLSIFAEIPRYTFDFVVKSIGWSLLVFFIFDLLHKKNVLIDFKEEPK